MLMRMQYAHGGGRSIGGEQIHLGASSLEAVNAFVWV